MQKLIIESKNGEKFLLKILDCLTNIEAFLKKIWIVTNIEILYIYILFNINLYYIVILILFPLLLSI